MLFKNRHIQIGPADVYYQTRGSGTPVVLIHGLSGSSRWWARNVDALARHFRVYTIDLINFGQTRGPQRFVLSEAADTLTAWMDHVGVERASLIGHSMGGFIAADLAARFPERADRLVLVDAALIAFERSYLGHAAGLIRAVRRLPLNFYPLLVTDALRAGPVSILGAARQLVTTDIRAKVAQIRADTLIVWGEHDTAVPLDIGRKLNRHLPDARFVIIEGAGHNPMWDRPTAFNRVVLDFLTASPDADGATGASGASSH